MRFRLGAMPADPNFKPEEANWNRLRHDPLHSFLQLWIYGFLIGMVTAPLMNFLWLLVGIDFIFPIRLSWFIGLLIPPIILIHEIIHAVFYPDFGISDKTIIGFWPSKMIAYAYHTAPISRNRLIWVGIAPLLFLSLFPIVLFVVLGGPRFWDKTTATVLFHVSFLNVLFSGGDILGIITVLREIPASAMVRFNGWDTFWKLRK